MGMKTTSIVAHNVNEWMQLNQYGGCAMMTMGCFSAEVIEIEVDPYGLGLWQGPQSKYDHNDSDQYYHSLLWQQGTIHMEF
jgi:hypothetical protein